MSWIEGARPHYFARLEREGPWWSVDFRDCPGCLTSGRGRREALRMAADALATWCANIPPKKLPKPTSPAPGEVLIAARFTRSPGLAWWGGIRFAAPSASYWQDKARGWR
ncbi:type II toxin-antitoxin system HicB family antitoxin [Xanthobacter tagetidis]|nr:hypothetical protein [Xanthobacter tagetidis]MBB6307141.1 putative RNase H-like HicB family nuclease [Xanthobacter tagetidis]